MAKPPREMLSVLLPRAMGEWSPPINQQEESLTYVRFFVAEVISHVPIEPWGKVTRPQPRGKS